MFGRGNHEDCQRGGYGWHYYFRRARRACDTRPSAGVCPLQGLVAGRFRFGADRRPVPRPGEQDWLDLAAKLKAGRQPGGPVLLDDARAGLLRLTTTRLASACRACPKSIAALAGVRIDGRCGAPERRADDHAQWPYPRLPGARHAGDDPGHRRHWRRQPGRVAKELMPPAMGDSVRGPSLELTDGTRDADDEGPGRADQGAGLGRISASAC